VQWGVGAGWQGVGHTASEAVGQGSLELQNALRQAMVRVSRREVRVC
jgi:hypothetical protein